MKKIGIVTIVNGPDNFGNSLQNYAVQEILKNMGNFKVETLRNFSYAEHKIGDIYLLIKLFQDRKGALKSIRFWKYRRKYIRFNSKILTRRTKKLEKWAKQFDFLICGSDQIWNPNYRRNQNWYINLLKFAENKQKIALSASFGVPCLI